MTSDYRIEKARLPVTLTMTDGARLAGEIFVQPFARYRPGRESVHDVMNSDDAYFPLALTEGGMALITKELVAEIEADGTMDDDPANTVAARPTEVELTLQGGQVRSGAMFLEVPLDRPRLLDFLNRFEQRFFTLHAADGMRLVNRRVVTRLRQLD
jgi:hypothetical protein